MTQKRKGRIKKSIWLPAILAIYLAAMAWFFRETLTVHHDYVRYFSVIGVDLVVLVALVIFLRKKERLAEERENLPRRSDVPADNKTED